METSTGSGQRSSGQWEASSAGFTSACNRDTPNGVELGHRFKRSAWGKHYAAEGSRTLIKKGFTGPGANTVVGSRWLATPGHGE